MDPHASTPGPDGLLCRGGCGVLLLPSSSPEPEHSCKDTLRALADALRDRSAAQEHEARMERLRWARTEHRLVARVNTVRAQARLHALRCRRRLHEYTLHAHDVMKHALGFYQVPGVTESTCLRAGAKAVQSVALVRQRAMQQEDNGIVHSDARPRTATDPMLSSRSSEGGPGPVSPVSSSDWT
ncbi:hypothetical protein WMY93_023397 [Mugilogobius chulae]|uniref:Uncharacterized protein n=1 Tax=Mugilogobius chulae TaxID=88201 RepID=A0AAW0N456_9GOBI